MTYYEREWMRAPLSSKVSIRIIVSGEMSPKLIGRLITLLDAHRAVLDDPSDVEPHPPAEPAELGGKA